MATTEKPDNSKFKIGNAKKDIKSIIKIAVQAKSKPKQAEKLINNNIDCNSVAIKTKDIDQCLKARQDVTDLCFGGVTDASHASEESALNSALKNLKNLSNALNC